MSETTEFIGAGTYVASATTKRQEFPAALIVTLANGDRHEYADWDGESFGGEGSGAHDYALSAAGVLHVAYWQTLSSGPPSNITRAGRRTVRSYGIGAWSTVTGSLLNDPNVEEPSASKSD